MIETREEYEYAGFWIRVGSTIIDAILQLIITTYPLYRIYGKEYFAPNEGAPFVWCHGWADLLLTWILPAVLTFAFWLWRCATPGKMAIRAVIVDARTGRRPSAAQFLIRYVGYVISLVPLGLGYLWIAWDKKRQGWHDKLAGTVVIREKHRGVAPVRFDAAC